jgi:bifunctional non-homologous end joining protein LigD
MREALPGLVVDAQAKHLRRGRVLVDWLQNDWRRSTVAPYSLRAGRAPSVSMPLPWPAFEEALDRRSEERLWFSPRRALERLAEHGDAFAEVGTLRQSLPVGP